MLKYSWTYTKEQIYCKEILLEYVKPDDRILRQRSNLLATSTLNFLK
jgi:hypothetical protein